MEAAREECSTMPKYTTADIRNLALTGSAGAGKTTLLEAMLHTAGIIGRAGRVEDGNTVADFDDMEKELKHSLDSALVHFDLDGAHLNIIDTPGAPDFIGKSISVLPAVETVVVVIDASAGIETVTQRLMKRAEERILPRLIVINKIDNATGLGELLEALKEIFGGVCLPINLPADGGTKIVDCLKSDSGESDLGDVADFHTAVVDQVVEVDEKLMEQYLEKGKIDPAELEAPFKEALREGHLVPVCFTSAREDVGVKELLDVFINLCPNPLEGNPRTFEYTEGGETKQLLPEASDDQPLLAHVFKVSSDPYVGKLSVFRVHQGHIGPDVSPRVDQERKAVRIAHVFKLEGKKHTEVDRIITGDIGAVAKIDEINYNSVLHSDQLPEDIHLKPLVLPKPMFGLAIEVATKGAESKLGEAIHKMIAEDPTLQVERVAATHQTVLRGLGEQHLRVKLRLLEERYGVKVNTEPPKVAYKETITSKAEGHHRHKKQTGGAGQFGEVYLRVEPLNGGEEGVINGLLFVDDTFGGSVPKQFMPAIEKGIRKVMSEGAIAGYPMQDVKVSVYDGKHHPVDSKEVAFITAGKKAFVDAVQKAKPVLLEPFVKMEITVPADQIGDISSDISGRRGRIVGTEMLPGNQAVVIAEAPLAEVMTYSSQLKSMTGGAGTYSMEYSHDEPTPPNVQAEVVKAWKPKDDEE
jgi:elongation factor G